MIVSHRNGFVMHSISKVASTTLLYTMRESGILGEEDVVSRFSIDAFNSADPKVYPSQNIPKISWDDFTYKVIEKPIHGIPYKGMIYCLHPVFAKMETSMKREDYQNTIVDLYAKAFTLKEMVDAGIIEDIDKYKIYGFIRDPIQRYISLFFMWSHTNGTGIAPRDLIQDIMKIDEKYGHPFFLNRKYSDYFEYDGRVFPPMIYEDGYKDKLKDIIESYGGTVNEIPKLKSEYRPDWSKGDYNKWLPEICIDKLNRVFAEDIEFYNKWRT